MEKADAHLYTVIKVARNVDLVEQIGRDIYFDLVDHEKVRSFRIKKQMPFNVFKQEVAKEFGFPVQYQRFWSWIKRGNGTYRPHKPLTSQEEAESVGQKINVLGNVNKEGYAELKLFLEVELGEDLRPVPPLVKTEEDSLLFFKLYDPFKEKLRYVGRMLVRRSGKPMEILTRINQMAGFGPDEDIELYEELKFEPNVICENINKELTFRASQLIDGDIICFQKSHEAGGSKQCRYPDVPSFLKYVRNRQVFQLHGDRSAVESDLSEEKFTFNWKIVDFSKISSNKLYSDIFCLGGYNWRILVYPKGNNVDHLSLYLDVADSANLTSGWIRYAQFSLTVINPNRHRYSIPKGTQHLFNAQDSEWGFTAFMPLVDLHDPSKGYLWHDACLIEADVLVHRSNDSVRDSDPEKKLTQKDRDTFFENLEFEIETTETVSSQKVKEALAKVEEALDIAPAFFEDSGRISSIQKAFKVLTNCNCSSAFTLNKKAELLSMEKKFKELPERAVRANKEKNLLIENESKKQTLNQSLASSLVKHNEAKAEAEEIEQKIATLRAQVTEEEKKKEKILGELREIFEACKNSKLELDILRKELSERKAMVKACEEEENTVAVEWSRMKDFVSSLRKAFN